MRTMKGSVSSTRLKIDLGMCHQLIPYFGTKAGIAHRYPVPQYATIIEPFAGGAGYALQHADRKVILVEKWPLMVALWRYLIRVSADEIRRLPIVPDVSELGDVPEEARWLVGWWLDPTTGRPQPKASTRWKDANVRGVNERSGSVRSYWGPERRSRVAREVERIRHWKIIEGDYTMSPSIAATWFIDPPYQVKGSTYVHSQRAIDFPALAGWCKAREGQVMVAENEGATWLPFTPLGVTTNRLNKPGNIVVNREVLWMNDSKAPCASVGP